MGNTELLITLLKESVDKCYFYDKTLIERSMEQASVARIYFYMQDALYYDKKYTLLKQYNLDCEYNKNGDHIKETARRLHGTKPDIVLHKRLSNNYNLLVVEFKPSKARKRKFEDADTNIDYIKLEDFTSFNVYNYSLGVFVKLNKRCAKYIYFQKGKETELQDLKN